ncbi:MAG: AAA family ATPase [Burkholderiaceae bacterium]|nr:AAA family ATPase [Burkholderiaceae bacterium]
MERTHYERGEYAKSNGHKPAKPMPFEPVAHSALDLLGKEFAPLRWVLNNLIPEGTILLAGKPKSGKSWFGLNLSVSAAMELHFLREPVTACSVLYLALEDNPRRIKQRLQLLCRQYAERKDALSRLQYRCDWPAGKPGAEALDQYLTANPGCKLVTVDVLKNIRPKTDGRRNAYDVDYESIEPWKRAAERHRVTLLFVHHTRKAEADDVFDEISGTLGINGAVDQMIVLRRLPGDHKQASLYMRGRDLIDDPEMVVELRDGWWQYVGELSAVAVTDARRQIVEILAEADAPMSTAEILKATGKKNRSSLSTLLGKMVEARQLTRLHRGRFAITTTT